MGEREGVRKLVSCFLRGDGCCCSFSSLHLGWRKCQGFPGKKGDSIFYVSPTHGPKKTRTWWVPSEWRQKREVAEKDLRLNPDQLGQGVQGPIEETGGELVCPEHFIIRVSFTTPVEGGRLYFPSSR